MAVYKKVKCIHCGNDDVRKYGKLRGIQRYHCHSGCGKTFQEAYKNKAWEPGTDKKVIDMAINGSGVRDTSRVLGISQTTIIKIIKKKPAI